MCLGNCGGKAASRRACCCFPACRQWCDVYSLPLPESVQIPVTEQLVRGWAAAAGQLTVQLTVLQAAAAAEAAKKAAAPAAAAGKAAAAAAPPPSVASGTLQLNCAGLLVGNTAARYSWRSEATAVSVTAALGQPQQVPQPEAAAAQDAVPASISSGTATAALARCQSTGKQQQQPVCPASPPAANSSLSCNSASCKPQRKAVQQPPGGNLQEWLGEANMQLQVGRDFFDKSIYCWHGSCSGHICGLTCCMLRCS